MWISLMNFIMGLLSDAWANFLLELGLTDEKIYMLLSCMRVYNVGILCIQETWIRKSDSYYKSGSDGPEDTRAGVGFILAPWVSGAVDGFLQYSNRIPADA